MSRAITFRCGFIIVIMVLLPAAFLAGCFTDVPPDEIMADVARSLDTDTMLFLNYLVDIARYEPGEAARDWLLGEGLVSKTPGRPVDGEPVIVGSKDFTEQLILGKIAVLALEDAGIPVIDSCGLGDSEAIRSALLKGTITHVLGEHRHRLEYF